MKIKVKINFMKTLIKNFFIITCFILISIQNGEAKNVRLFYEVLGKYEVKHFKNQNEIKLNQSEEGFVSSVEHNSNNSATGLYQILNIDLRKEDLRYLYFDWYSEKFININERKKEFHDFPARIYLTFRKKTFPFELPFQLPWERYHINYVFSNVEDQDAHWKSPYLSFFTKSHDVVISGKWDPANYWISNKIDLKSDIQKFWNIDLNYLESVALMVDTDNTGRKTKTLFRNVYLSKN